MTHADGANGSRVTAVQKLRNLLADEEKLIVCPGVYDGYTARIALQEGAECLYMVRSNHISRFTDRELPHLVRLATDMVSIDWCWNRNV